MSDLENLKKDFENMLERVKNKTVSKTPTQTEKLKLYAWYKQATEGDVQGEAPTGFDIVGKAKYKAWSETKGMSAMDAMQHYLDFFQGA
jgi:3-hydroxyacyl-CoA dehydrogenase